MSLFFYYSAMNAGKTTALLQMNYNYIQRKMTTLLFCPSIDTRFDEKKIVSRIGINANSLRFDDSFSFIDYVKEKTFHAIFVDEAQFMNNRQIDELAYISDKNNINVYTYGLRTDYMGNLFEGSARLLGIADELIKIRTICYCGNEANMNIMIDAKGNKINAGEQIIIGDSCYESVCRKHFYNSM